jgi:hypothetical protein
VEFGLDIQTHCRMLIVDMIRQNKELAKPSLAESHRNVLSFCF